MLFLQPLFLLHELPNTHRYILNNSSLVNSVSSPVPQLPWGRCVPSPGPLTPHVVSSFSFHSQKPCLSVVVGRPLSAQQPTPQAHPHTDPIHSSHSHSYSNYPARLGLGGTKIPATKVLLFLISLLRSGGGQTGGEEDCWLGICAISGNGGLLAWGFGSWWFGGDFWGENSRSEA